MERGIKLYSHLFGAIVAIPFFVICARDLGKYFGGLMAKEWAFLFLATLVVYAVAVYALRFIAWLVGLYVR